MTPHVGLIGYGYWGPNIGRNLHHLCGESWVAAADASPARCDALRRLYPWLRVNESPLAVLEDPDVEAVVIATPAATHSGLVRSALERGKHVCVEKPLSLSAAEGLELALLAQERSLVLMVGHTFEYNPTVLELKRLLDAGAFGALLYMHSQRVNLGRVQHDINAMWSIGPHDVSISNFLVGSCPDWVSAQGAHYLGLGVEDVVFATLGYGAVLSHVHVSWLDPMKVRRLTLVGSERMAVYDDLDSEARLKIYDKGADPVSGGRFGEYQVKVRTGDISAPKIPLAEPLTAELEDFLGAVSEGRPPRVDALNGVRVVATLEAVERSLREGGARVPVETSHA